MGVAGKEASGRIRAALEQRGIELIGSAGVTEVARNGREASFGDGSSTTADIIATVPVHKMPDVVASSGISGGKPWVPVDRGTLETSVSNVFAIGDVNVVPSGDFAIPKAGVFAAGQGTKVGEIIASRINDSGTPGCRCLGDRARSAASGFDGAVGRADTRRGNTFPGREGRPGRTRPAGLGHPDEGQGPRRSGGRGRRRTAIRPGDRVARR